jgi:type IV pilus assembly protein PilY1
MTTRSAFTCPRWVLASLALLGVAAQAGTADIANLPLSVLAVRAKPNIVFILDDSGSMDSRYMPDEMSDSSRYGFWSSQCNGVAYNPAITYVPPVDYQGIAYPNATFTNAWRDGFNPSGSKTNLDNAGSFDNYATYYRYTGSQPAMGWAYLPNNSVDTSTTFYAECQASIGGAAPFTTVRVTSASPDAQNYANWFAYYRTRMDMMRTTTGRAFSALDSNYRVGFTAISDKTVTSSQFLDVADFNSGVGGQKAKFYDKLYTVFNLDYTPLRGALAKVGQYYGKVAPGQSYDPMQYSCQRSYAILSTDGYWNANIETATYGPYKLDGSLVGEQDDTEARPMQDDPAKRSSNSLADVAEYYWRTDLRPDLADQVPTNSSDANNKQHMNTFTVGLAQRGTLTYDPNYLTQTSGDFADLKSGAKNWPDPSSGEGATRIDDLWHAAVNGRGQYFAATDPLSLSAALTTTLARISQQSGSGSGAAAGGSTLTPVSGDDWLLLPSFTNVPTWSGDLRGFKYTFSAGKAVLPDTSKGQELWSAATKLDARDISRSPRNILFNNRGALSPFSYGNLRSAGLNGYFNGRCTTAPVLSQCGGLAATPLAKVTGPNLVAFLAGDTSLYLSATDPNNRVFRTRASRLGDIVNASPAYVGKPPFMYSDAGYASFVSAKSTRTKMVYAAANDGMLHAFVVADDGTGGTELWAFVPTAVMPNLWQLADAAFDSQHRYFVDATPVIGDVFDGTNWRTLLVGGLGGGGRSYYALDITDPAYPALLWEYNAAGSDANLGLTYGNPIITKNAAGTWVVAFTSGLNNNVASGDGRGRLYVLNAVTGASITTLSTGVGDSATPSNLSRIEGWVVSATNNVTQRFYGGDMLGNLWRFDYDSQLTPVGQAVALGVAQAPGGEAQPITSKPVLTELAINGSRIPVVAFGTGRYLGLSDLTDNTLQSIYAVKDNLTSTGLGVLRSSGANLVKEQLDSNRLIASPALVDWATTNGWYVDLDQSSGERSYLDGAPLATGVLGFASTVPGSDVCLPGGTAYLYQFNLTTGTVATVAAFNTLLVGLGRIIDPSGEISAVLTRQDQTLDKKLSSGGIGAIGGSVKRATWRELTN